MTYLKAWRKFYGLTQQQLADRIKRDRSLVARWESAGAKMQIDSLQLYAGALGVDVADLFRPPPALRARA